jgi:PAS domain S-box-containing protein
MAALSIAGQAPANVFADLDHSAQELARREARYRTLLSISTDLIWTTANNDGQKTTDQIEWQAFTGQTDAQSRGFHWLDAVHPDDREATLAAWRHAVADGTIYQVQHRLRRHDGVYRTMQVRAVPYRDTAGNIIEWVGMHTDITDQMTAKADVGLAHEKLESMLTGMTDGLAIRDNEGRYTYMSERAAQILGVDRKAVIGKHYLEVFPTARHSEIEVQTRRALETRQPAHFERYLAGSVNKWLEYHYYPTEEGLSVYVRDITERKTAEEAHARAEVAARRVHETLEGVLAGMTDGLCIVDKHWCYTYFNEQGGRLLGVRAQDMLGRCIWDVFPPAEESSFGQACHQAVDTGEPVHIVDYYQEPMNKWIESHCYPSADGLSIYFRDVTPAKLAEQAIARSEMETRKASEKLQAVLSHMTDGLFMIDRDWSFTYFSEQGAHKLGVRAEDMLGHNLLVVYPHSVDTSFRQRCGEAMSNGRPAHFEAHYLEPQNRWIEYHAYPSADGLSVYFRDISERKDAEGSLAQSVAETRTVNETLAGVLAGMTDGLAVVDTGWRFTYFNEQAGLLLGVSAKDMLGKRLWDMFPAAEEASFGLKMREAVASGKLAHTLDFYPDPINKWLDCHYYPSSEGLSIYFHDVTAKLEADEALQRSEKLVLAGQLAASISTEIKAPLETAANLLTLSLQMTLADPVRSNLIRAEQEIARVARATTQTLRFHRHSTTIPTRADVIEMLDSNFEIFAPRFTAAGINVERDYTSGPRLFCYGDEIRQVFANLLSNALEATPHGGTVRLRVRPAPFFGGIRVTIADTGHGIPAAFQPRIFDLFASTKDDTGAGLGLWVSEGIMRKHKGRISMRSRTASANGPHGTVFAIFLPYLGIEPDLATKAASRRLPHPTAA